MNSEGRIYSRRMIQLPATVRCVEKFRHWRIRLRRTILCAGWMMVGAAFCGTVMVPEKYCRSMEDGIYTNSAWGQAVGVLNPPLVYPVVWRQKQVTEGTAAVRFKALLGQKDAQGRWSPFVVVQDDTQIWQMAIYPYSQPKATNALTQAMSFMVRDVQAGKWQNLGGVNLGANAHERYHHLIFTWNAQKAAIYLNGQKVKEMTRPADGVWIKPFAGSATIIKLNGFSWFDEVVILDRFTEDAAAEAMSAKTWTLDDSTAFCAKFDGRLDGISVVGKGDGSAHFLSYVGHPDATFRADEPAQFEFTIVNPSGAEKTLTLKGVVKDLDRKIVLEKQVPVKVAAADAARITFDMRDIRKNGLFWGYFTLEDSGVTVHQETIPFARTLAVDISKFSEMDINTGITEGLSTMGFNPPVYDKWHQMHYEFWRDMEVEPGQWYFDRMDMRVEALIKTGRTPIMILYGTPDWQTKRMPVDKKLGPQPHPEAAPDDIEAWKTYVRKVGERYKGKVHWYEVWNCEAYFLDASQGMSSEQQAELVRTAAEILHGLDPSNKVMAAMGGYGAHQQIMAERTAGFADCYEGSHYVLFDQHLPFPEKTLWEMPMGLLKAAKASTQIANLEFGVYSLSGAGVGADGYPLTAEEFRQQGIWEKMPEVYRKWGKPFPDYYTIAFMTARATVVGMACGLICNAYWSTDDIGSFSDLLYKFETPSPPSAAYANVSGLLAGFHYVRRLNISTPDLKAYLFSNGHEYRVVTFSDGAESPAYFEKMTGPNLRVLDLYGNETPAERLGSVLALTLKSNALYYIIGVAGVPDESRPILDMSGAKTALPGMTNDLTLALYNPMDQSVKGRVELNLPAGFAELPSRDVVLGPHYMTNLVFALVMPKDAIGSYLMEARFVTDGILKTVRANSEVKISPMTIARKLAAPPRLDGALAAWGDPEQFPVRLDQASQLIKGIPIGQIGNPRYDWKGANDLSGCALVAWDNANLYVAVRVYDDILENLWLAKEEGWCIRAYDGDSIELFLDARLPEEQGNPVFSGAAYHLVIVPPLMGRAVFVRVQKPRGKTLLGLEALPGLEVKSTVLKDGYAAEIKIPWSALPGLKPVAGLNIGFDLGLSDNNESFIGANMTDSKAILRWTGARASQNPSLFGRIILSDKP